MYERDLATLPTSLRFARVGDGSAQLRSVISIDALARYRRISWTLLRRSFCREGSLRKDRGQNSPPFKQNIDARIRRGGDLLPFDADCTISKNAEPVYWNVAPVDVTDARKFRRSLHRRRPESR